jgi:dihydroneopterin aldolase
LYGCFRCRKIPGRKRVSLIPCSYFIKNKSFTKRVIPFGFSFFTVLYVKYSSETVKISWPSWHLDEETLIGNNFEVSVTVNFIAKGPIESLSDTVNYVELHHIIKEIFHQPVKLLETLAEEICDKLHQYDNRIKRVEISINKLNPPINNFTGTVGVSLSKDYEVII